MNGATYSHGATYTGRLVILQKEGTKGGIKTKIF